MSTSDYTSQIDSAAASSGVPAPVLAWVINQESSGNPSAYNPSSGATGLAQAIPSTAADPGYGISPFDPEDPDASINFSAQYLAALHNLTGSWTSAVEKYGTFSSGSSLQGSFQNMLTANGISDSGSSSSSSSSGSSSFAQKFEEELGAISGNPILSSGVVGGSVGGLINTLAGNAAGSYEPAGDQPGSLAGFVTEAGTRIVLVALGLVCLIGGFMILGRERAVSPMSASLLKSMAEI